MNARVRAASRAAQRQNQEGEATCLEQQHISRQSLDGHDEVRRERQTLHLRPLDGLLLSHNDASVPPVRERASDVSMDRLMRARRTALNSMKGFFFSWHATSVLMAT